MTQPFDYQGVEFLGKPIREWDPEQLDAAMETVRRASTFGFTERERAELGLRGGALGIFQIRPHLN